MAEFVRVADGESDVLRANGARDHADARDRVLEQLLDAAGRWLDTELTTAQAAELIGRNEETVRRAVRDGKVESRRSSRKGHNHLRRGDVVALDRRRSKDYDAVADAQDIAQLRRSA
jgi:hypothetical protein